MNVSFTQSINLAGAMLAQSDGPGPSTQFRLWPQQASHFAVQVDTLMAYLLAVSVFFTLLIFLLILYFGLKYRRRPGHLPQMVPTNYALEVIWTAIPLALVMVMFVWGAALYVHEVEAPRDAMEIQVIGKQWMWKVQHPQGRREIDQLTIPVNQTVKLHMTSQDVIHSFYIPAFRVKQDVLPGQYTTEWFRPTKVGEYHLFCAEYCGAEHSGMIGKVVVMEPGKYQQWLAGSPADLPPAVAGEKLYVQYSCQTCHGERAPTLAGLYLRTSRVLENGQLKSVVADDAYLRESILNPSAKIVEGYPPLMPTYQGQLTEEQIMELIAYIKSLGSAANPREPSTAPQTNAPSGGGQRR